MKTVTASVCAMQNRLNRRMLPAPTQLLIQTLLRATNRNTREYVSSRALRKHTQPHATCHAPVMVHALDTHVAASAVLGAQRLHDTQRTDTR